MTSTTTTNSDSSHSVVAQKKNWDGAIPVVVRLSNRSLSSPTLPPPHHVLVSRHAYLHVALRDVVYQLQDFAPLLTLFTAGAAAAGSQPDSHTAPKQDQTIRRTEPEPGAISLQETDDSDNKFPKGITKDPPEETPKKEWTYPICWFEDDETQTPLRWHLFAGVLYDTVRFHKNSNITDTTTTKFLPWKITLHFNLYPQTQLLPFWQPIHNHSVLEQVRYYYKHSLKQALSIQTGSAKAALKLSKEQHGRLWHAILGDDTTTTTTTLQGGGTAAYTHYRQVQQEEWWTKYDQPLLTATLPESSSSSHPQLQVKLPIRLLIHDRPPLQRPCPVFTTNSSNSSFSWTTLGDFLVQHAGEYFAAQPTSSDTNDKDPPGQAASQVQWIIAGLAQLPLETPMVQLWHTLHHPDRFLHIVLVGPPK